jgi:hypothetical protein
MIINGNYFYGAEDGRLTRFSQPEEKPWKVCGSGRIEGFPTHAEAIQYADKLARESK